MAVTCGFFDSLNGDRKYYTDDMSRLFDGLITDGIFSTYARQFHVKPGTGMQVIVEPGRAWFNHRWTLNDADLPLTIDPSDINLNRVDTIVIDVNETERVNDIVVVKGDNYRGEGQPKDLINIEGHHQYPLAYIWVSKKLSQITVNNVEDRRGVKVGDTVPCPFVTGSSINLDIGDFLDSWQKSFDDLIIELQNKVDQISQTTVVKGQVSSWFETVINTSDWEFDSTKTGYHCVKSVSGLSIDDTPIIGLNSFSDEMSDVEDMEEAWSLVYAVKARDNVLDCWAKDKPQVSIKLQMQCVRK